MDDFEAFRQRKLAAKQAEAHKDPEAEAKLGWIDGLGPKGPTNPKIKGFILGRYQRKKVDPSTLERPKGYESTALDQGDHHTPPEELEKRDGPDVKGFRRF